VSNHRSDRGKTDGLNQHIILLVSVYDITARDTFESLTSWIAELDTFAGPSGSGRDVVRMIVGNKVDKVSFAAIMCTLHGSYLTAYARNIRELLVRRKANHLQLQENLPGILWSAQLNKVVQKSLERKDYSLA
jgi:GTPase SAR1 family protein